MCTSHTSAIKIEIIDSHKGLQNIKSDWDRLFQIQQQSRQLPSGSDVFLAYCWQDQWLSLFERGLLSSGTGKPSLLALSRNNEIVAIAPMCLIKKRGFTSFEWNGQPATQYGDILLGDLTINEAMDSIISFVKETIKPDFFSLRKTHETANIYPYLEKSAVATKRMSAPFIDLSKFQSFEDYFARFSQRGRKSRRRHRRKMAEHGALSFAIHEHGPQAIEAINIALQLKRNWLEKYSILSKGLNSKDLDQVFALAGEENAPPTGLLVSQLKSGDETIAVEIGFAQGRAYVAHFGAYDLAYERHGPGALQMEDTIAALMKRDIATLDLLAPEDGYKLQWADTSSHVKDFALPISVKGKAFVALWLKGLRPAIVKTVHSLPPGLKAKLSKYI